MSFYACNMRLKISSPPQTFLNFRCMLFHCMHYSSICLLCFSYCIFLAFLAKRHSNLTDGWAVAILWLFKIFWNPSNWTVYFLEFYIFAVIMARQQIHRTADSVGIINYLVSFLIYLVLSWNWSLRGAINGPIVCSTLLW